MVGDAAHIMPPNMAMGTPSAFEDAVQLAHSVNQHGLTPQALRHYEQSRQPRVNRIADEAIRQTGLHYQEKDNDANPFKLNNQELMKMNHQASLGDARSHLCILDGMLIK
jgi:2-polyprenyl-6-methoxyphenol hydroxylase-like FAD-dependent oxidoreductase